MLYQRYMIYRVRSNCHLSYSTQKKRHRARIALLVLPLMALCGTGIYGSFASSTLEHSTAAFPPAPSKDPALSLPTLEPVTEVQAQLAETRPTEAVALVFEPVGAPPTGAEQEVSSPQASVSVIAPPSEPAVALAPAAPTEAPSAAPEVHATATDAEAKPAATHETAPVAAEIQPPAFASAPAIADATTQEVSTQTAEVAPHAVVVTPAPEAAPVEQIALPAEEALVAAPTQQTPAAPLLPAESDEGSLVDEDNIGSRWVETKVQPGDSLPKIFGRLNLPTSLLHEIVDSGKAGKELTNLQPGETFRVLLDPERQIQELVYRRNALSSIQVTPDGDGFKVRKIDKPTTVRKAQITGTITNSLYESAKKAGLSDRMILDMAQIFGWDIDFALEIQPGDRFTVIFDEEYVEGEKFRNGPILAAEFVNEGKVFRAFRFDEGDGHASYFNADGKGMRKAFLRAPLDFLRVTSRFQTERFHPVLGVKRPHKGVDYGAPTGTPVYAAGDGKVEFAGSKSGYGNTVILQHGDGRSTLYGHLSKINGKVDSGGRVKQGQVIGYVGATGLATGPHLHYEFRVNGEHRNPENIKLPNNIALEKAQKEKFRKGISTFVAELDQIAKTQVAEANVGQSRIQ